jgi:hypothetical protein
MSSNQAPKFGTHVSFSTWISGGGADSDGKFSNENFYPFDGLEIKFSGLWCPTMVPGTKVYRAFHFLPHSEAVRRNFIVSFTEIRHFRKNISWRSPIFF